MFPRAGLEPLDGVADVSRAREHVLLPGADEPGALTAEAEAAKLSGTSTCDPNFATKELPLITGLKFVSSRQLVRYKFNNIL